jgi:hypothetical protein
LFAKCLHIIRRKAQYFSVMGLIVRTVFVRMLRSVSVLGGLLVNPTLIRHEVIVYENQQ